MMAEGLESDSYRRGLKHGLTDSTVRAGETFLTLTLAVDALPPVVTSGVLALIGGNVTLRPFPALVTDTHTLAVFSLAITKVGAFTWKNK